MKCSICHSEYKENYGGLLKGGDMCFSCNTTTERIEKYARPVIFDGRVFLQLPLDDIRGIHSSGSYYGSIFDAYFIDNGDIVTMCLSHPNIVPVHFKQPDTVHKLVSHYAPISISVNDCMNEPVTGFELMFRKLPERVIRYIDGSAITYRNIDADRQSSRIKSDGVSIGGYSMVLPLDNA